jgi:hypothetical protein
MDKFAPVHIFFQITPQNVVRLSFKKKSSTAIIYSLVYFLHKQYLPCCGSILERWLNAAIHYDDLRARMEKWQDSCGKNVVSLRLNPEGGSF